MTGKMGVVVRGASFAERRVHETEDTTVELNFQRRIELRR